MVAASNKQASNALTRWKPVLFYQPQKFISVYIPSSHQCGCAPDCARHPGARGGPVCFFTQLAILLLDVVRAQAVDLGWYLNQTSNWSPTTELLDFLNSGPPPVYIGFGSMNAGEAERSTRIVLEAVKENNMRAILLRGWGGLHSDDLPGSVFMLDFIPHDWLFPLMSTIIHHGGAGTTGAAFRC